VRDTRSARDDDRRGGAFSLDLRVDPTELTAIDEVTVPVHVRWRGHVDMIAGTTGTSAV
jgi:hypothetical protein